MKKLSILLLTLFGGIVNAQVVDTCEVWFNDTVAFVDTKSSAIAGISVNHINDGGAYGYAGYAQKFEAPDTVNVLGLCFYGVMDSGADGVVDVKMYDGTSGSPGAVIAATTQVVPFFGSGYTGAMDDPSIMLCATFPAPVQWEGDYFVGIENFTSSDMYVARNTDGDGLNEGLGFTYYKGVTDPAWDGWYDMSMFIPAGWDFDLLFRPVISYSGQSILSYDSIVCYGDTLSVDSEFIVDDSLMYNRFYNPNFASYTGYTATHQFDYGDVSPVTGDTFHSYTGGGDYTLTHNVDAGISGWGSNSFEADCMVDLEVVVPYFDIADVSACAGDSIYLVAAPDYDSYSWIDLSTNDSLLVETDGMLNGDSTLYVDFELKGCTSSDTIVVTVGDLVIDLGEDTSLCLNQNIILTAGTFDAYNWNTGQVTETIQVGPFIGAGQEEIVLEATSGNCTGADTIMITIDDCLGIEGNEVAFDVYPNPSNGVINLQSSVNVKSVVVYNLSGAKVFESEVLNTQLIELGDVEDGVYILEVNTALGVGHKKIQIIQ